MVRKLLIRFTLKNFFSFFLGGGVILMLQPVNVIWLNYHGINNRF